MVAALAVAHTSPVADLPLCRRPLAETMSRALRLAPKAESEGYATPDAETLRRVKRSLKRLLAGKAERAFREALVGGYWLCRNEDDVAVGVPAIPGVGRAIFAWRPAEDARPLILEAPHPRYDVGTGRQAVDLFEAVRARVLIVAGTHRCANSLESGCDGASNACGNLTGFGGFRESDMAHALGSVFMGVHRFFADAYPEDLVVSVHGMSFPGVSVSDGTLVPADEKSPVARLSEALKVAFPEEEITVCNAYPGGKLDHRLCGTTNVQGRYLNGIVLDACSETATRSAGRFLHMEQSQAVRAEWPRVADALEQILEPLPEQEAPEEDAPRLVER